MNALAGIVLSVAILIGVIVYELRAEARSW